MRRKSPTQRAHARIGLLEQENRRMRRALKLAYIALGSQIMTDQASNQAAKFIAYGVLGWRDDLHGYVDNGTIDDKPELPKVPVAEGGEDDSPF